MIYAVGPRFRVEEGDVLQFCGCALLVNQLMLASGFCLCCLLNKALDARHGWASCSAAFNAAQSGQPAWPLGAQTVLNHLSFLSQVQSCLHTFIVSQARSRSCMSALLACISIPRQANSGRAEHMGSAKKLRELVWPCRDLKQAKLYADKLNLKLLTTEVSCCSLK